STVAFSFGLPTAMSGFTTGCVFAAASPMVDGACACTTEVGFAGTGTGAGCTTGAGAGVTGAGAICTRAGAGGEAGAGGGTEGGATAAGAAGATAAGAATGGQAGATATGLAGADVAGAAVSSSSRCERRVRESDQETQDSERQCRPDSTWMK